jgi:hypothetical protein
MRIKKITRGLAPLVLLAATPATLVFAYSSYDDCRNDPTPLATCESGCNNAYPNGGSQLDGCLVGCALDEQRRQAWCEDEFWWC